MAMDRAIFMFLRYRRAVSWAFLDHAGYLGNMEDDEHWTLRLWRTLRAQTASSTGIARPTG
jgi:hypothetical protein